MTRRTPQNPGEHFDEAQRLADMVVRGESDRTPPGAVGAVDATNYEWIKATIALAQVHATLALYREDIR